MKTPAALSTAPASAATSPSAPRTTQPQLYGQRIRWPGPTGSLVHFLACAWNWPGFADSSTTCVPPPTRFGDLFPGCRGIPDASAPNRMESWGQLGCRPLQPRAAGDPATVVHVGSADLRKAPDCGVSWLRLAPGPGPNSQAKLVLGGHGTDGLADPPQGVQGMGFVSDDREILARGQLFLNPQQIGAGIKLKSITAMLAGKALVSTPTGIEGVEGREGRHFFVAETAEALADQIVALIRSPAQVHAAAREARALAAARYSQSSLSAVVQPLLKAFVSASSRIAMKSMDERTRCKLCKAPAGRLTYRLREADAFVSRTAGSTIRLTLTPSMPSAPKSPFVSYRQGAVLRVPVGVPSSAVREPSPRRATARRRAAAAFWTSVAAEGGSADQEPGALAVGLELSDVRIQYARVGLWAGRGSTPVDHAFWQEGHREAFDVLTLWMS